MSEKKPSAAERANAWIDDGCVSDGMCDPHGHAQVCQEWKAAAHAALDEALREARRETLEMVRTYHRSGGEIHETWLHKQIRKCGEVKDAD